MYLCPIALCVLAMLGIGCSEAVHPPLVKMTDAVPIYVADYGVHSAVMLPVGGNRYVEYAFGDWGFCACNHVGPQDAFGALVVSFSSAFGRRYNTLRPGQTYPVPRTRPERVIKMYAPRQAVAREVRKLDERWARGAREKVVHNPINDTDYVRDEERYSWTNSCNHLTAATLRDLGCKVEGPTILSNFYLSDPIRQREPAEEVAPVYASGSSPAVAPGAPPVRKGTTAESKRQFAVRTGPVVPGGVEFGRDERAREQ
ncbi:MAG TPA: hypothetical protein VFC78_21395 [Tepidisphaeraceae bacterium]|nr:hypothetical protein [Tepidisphaeraceae bacterium]